VMNTLTLQTKVNVPTAVYVPQVLIQTGINMGEIHTSCQIVLAAVMVDEVGRLVPTGQMQTIYISDIDHLEPSLTKLGVQVSTFYNNLMTVLEAVNETLQVL